MKEEVIFGEKLPNKVYKKRVGAYGIAFNNENKVAIVKTSTGYFLPGGGLEESESHKTCIEREFIEETGYEVEVLEYIGEASKYHYSDTLNYYMHGVGHFYNALLKKKISDIVEEDHSLVWLDIEDAIDKLFLEHQAWAVKQASK